MAAPVARILLISLSNIGDAVMTTPVLETLHQAWPGARIDIVGDRRSAQIFELCPYRGEIILKHKREGRPGLWRLIRRLRCQRYDLIVDLRTDGLAYLLRGRKRLHKWRQRRRGVHAVEQHMNVLRPLGLDRMEARTRVWLDAGLRERAKDLLAPLPGGSWLAVGPGANWAGKIWPLAAYQELCRLSRARFDGLILLGGPGDRDIAARLAGDTALPCVNLCGHTDLLQAAAVLECARVFIGNDSGLGHLASAVATPSLTVFGPGEPQRYHPWGPRAEWILAAGRDLQRLSASEVFAALEALLARTPA